ncbi:MAG: peptide chain release factor 1 [Myxococcales bacterium]|nr:peptide chain release factor 1 [Myxococcales bacterium]
MSNLPDLRDIEARYQELNRLLSQPDIATDPKALRNYAREHSQVEELVMTYRRYTAAQEELAENVELLKDDDPEMRELAQLEQERLKEEIATLEEAIKLLLLPTDPNDGRNVILEVRAGAGGDEASLFAMDLFRMYSRYAEQRGWKVEILSSSENDLGGFKEVIALVGGDGVYSSFKYEGGVHRVQRVPVTESQGRIHTSTCTVAIMPEAEDVEVHIDNSDLKIDYYRASGAGGQHVNTTDSAVRITHQPTGLVVQCQDERSQHKNKARAMKILKSRLLELEQQAQSDELGDTRRSQVGTGDRSERIRTYNYPQNRVTDHRIGLTLYKLDQVIEGSLEHVFEPLTTHFQAEALRELQHQSA